MTHLLLKWNMFKRSLFYSCIIGLAIYAVRWQLTDFVYSARVIRSQMCSRWFSLNVCTIKKKKKKKKQFKL